jgi:ABC-type Fe3+/spermidine/putrescine transport system ATPase subunit
MLKVHDLCKTFDALPLLQGISFVLGAGETLCLLGPSGSGKSTLLRMIAGLEPPDAGQILWNENDLSSTPAHLRDFGLVFQDYALFPHLNVFDNVAFGLKMKNWKIAEIGTRVAEVLDLVNLRGFDHRKVTDLSGGEQQRVALARALAPRPRLLMFDEPLGALDRALREELLAELRGILHRTGIPAVYVTHDQDEAFTIADRVLLLHEGKIVRQGTPAEVWLKPDSAWVAEFLGLGNVIEGSCRLQSGKSRGCEVETGFGIFDVKCGHLHRAGEKIHLLVRPRAAAGESNKIQGRVADVLFQQDGFKVRLDNGLYFYLKDEPKIGQKIEIKIKLECLE